MRPARVPAGPRRLPAQYPPAGPKSSRAPGLEELRVQQAEGAGPVGGAQARGGRPAQREGAEVLGGEGDHVGRLAQQQEEQEVGDERFGLRMLLQVSSSLSTSQRLHSPSSLMMGILVTTQQPGKPTWTLLARCLESNTGEGVSIPTPLRAVLGASLYFCIPANPPLVFEFPGQVHF